MTVGMWPTKSVWKDEVTTCFFSKYVYLQSKLMFLHLKQSTVMALQHTRNFSFSCWWLQQKKVRRTTTVAYGRREASGARNS